MDPSSSNPRTRHVTAISQVPEESIDAKLRTFAVSRDPALRNELVTAHLSLVERLARRYEHRSEPLEDLVQAGTIGLIKAVENFNPELGFEFGAYARTTILGELKRHFRDRGWSVRVPRRIQELYLELNPVSEELSQRLGRAPKVSELAEALGASAEDVIEAMEAGHAYRTGSLDQPGPDGETIGSRLGHDDASYQTVEDQAVLSPLLALLPERERLIFRLRFIDNLTQSEIATRIGVSQMHVSRLLARSLQQLHEAYATEP